MGFDPQPYDLWGAIIQWLLVVGVFGLIFVGFGTLVALIGGGSAGAMSFLRRIGVGFVDFIKISPRRVSAITRLAFLESLRRKALLVFAVFAVIFMFAGWFLTDLGERPELAVKTNITFVLRTITWLILPVILLLACWSLPEDIKARSLHTVITKPVRRNEVILGRILGLTAIASILVSVMGVIGYFWIVRQTPDRAKEYLVSRVPVYGKLSFANGFGLPIERGKNVGDVWDFRSFIDGDSAELAIWRFDADEPERLQKPLGEVIADEELAIAGERAALEESGSERAVQSPYQFADGLRDEPAETPVIELEAHFEVFRTYKGDLTRGVGATMWAVNPYRRDFAWAFANDSHLGQAAFLMTGGQYAVAADQLREDADLLRNDQWYQVAEIQKDDSGQPIPVNTRSRMTGREYTALADGFGSAIEMLDKFEEYRQTKGLDSPEWSQPVREAIGAAIPPAKALAEAATPNPNSVTPEGREALANALDGIADALETHNDAMAEQLVDLRGRLPFFRVREFKQNNIVFDPATLDITGLPEGQDGNFYTDLIRDGVMTIDVACYDRAQLLGMARPDLFVRTDDRPFVVGYAKAVLGIWLMMVMVTVIGITASTFVKGPVATLLTFSAVILGTAARDLMAQLIAGEIEGGGPIEQTLRLLTHKQPRVPLDPGPFTTFIQGGELFGREIWGADRLLIGFLNLVRQLVPNFEYVEMKGYVANGFDVPWNASLLPALVITVGLLLPCLLIGHFSLKLREIESK